MPFLRKPFLCVVTLAVQHAAVVAQKYVFTDVQIPGNRSLHTLHAFYVYSRAEAPGRFLGKPFVSFSRFSAQSSSKARSAADLTSYRGVQLSIMRHSDFWSLINPRKFCSTWDDVQKGVCEHQDQLLVRKEQKQSFQDVDVYIHTVSFSQAPQDRALNVQTTGVYTLVFSNCGDLEEATVTGAVIVRNAYGFLPGNEYHKMPFYGWLSLVYVGLGVIWMTLSIRWWKELFNIQNCISFVILFGLLEAFLWFVFLSDWNRTGVRGTLLFIFALLLTVLKTTFSYMLVLVASLGWGITRPYLDHGVILKIQVLCFFYIVLDFIRECALALRHSHSLSMAFVLLCLSPVSLLNGGVFCWVFTALSSSMGTLKERCQSEKLILFQRLWHILIIALGTATFTLLFQIFNLSEDSISRWKYQWLSLDLSEDSRWKYQWLLTDAVPHALFLTVLAAMMYLWAPHKYSQRWYAYSTQAREDAIGAVEEARLRDPMLRAQDDAWHRALQEDARRTAEATAAKQADEQARLKATRAAAEEEARVRDADEEAKKAELSDRHTAKEDEEEEEEQEEIRGRAAVDATAKMKAEREEGLKATEEVKGLSADEEAKMMAEQEEMLKAGRAAVDAAKMKAEREEGLKATEEVFGLSADEEAKMMAEQEEMLKAAEEAEAKRTSADTETEKPENEAQEDTSEEEAKPVAEQEERPRAVEEDEEAKRRAQVVEEAKKPEAVAEETASRGDNEEAKIRAAPQEAAQSEAVEDEGGKRSADDKARSKGEDAVARRLKAEELAESGVANEEAPRTGEKLKEVEEEAKEEARNATNGGAEKLKAVEEAMGRDADVAAGRDVNVEVQRRAVEGAKKTEAEVEERVIEEVQKEVAKEGEKRVAVEAQQRAAAGEGAAVGEGAQKTTLEEESKKAVEPEAQAVLEEEEPKKKVEQDARLKAEAEDAGKTAAEAKQEAGEAAPEAKGLAGEAQPQQETELSSDSGSTAEEEDIS